MVTTPSEISRFKYEFPREFNGRRETIWFPETDHMLADVQVLGRGGETTLHAHTYLDGLWFVLSGKLRFYSDATTAVGDLGRYEGVLVPRGCPYWFEMVDDEPVEVLQIECSDRPLTKEEARKERADLNNPTFVPRPLEVFKYEFPEFDGSGPSPGSPRPTTFLRHPSHRPGRRDESPCPPASRRDLVRA